MPLIAVLVVIHFLTNQALTSQFQRFQIERGRALAQGVVGILINYYQMRGDWEGVQVFFDSQGLNAVLQQRIGEGSFIVADEGGKVIVSADQAILGRVLAEEQLQEGLPIEVDDKKVGSFLVGPVADNFSPAEERFLASLNGSIWIIGAIGAVLGILLILLLYGQLAVFVRRFSQAADKIAGGALDHRIPVWSQDEIGQLAHTFNEMVAKLQVVQQLRSNMIADIAHELRTPLTVIRTNLEALTSGTLPASNETLCAVYKHTLLLSRLIDDLMELHLMEGGGLPLHLQEANLAELIQGIATHVKPSFENQGLRLTVRVPLDLPPVAVDVERLEQVLLNLLANAQHHTPNGGRIAIDVVRCNGETQIRVSDSGCGIPPQDLPYVFERFYRAESSSLIHNGTGLGLAIAKGLIEAHGGRICAESQLGQGATFTVSLPLAKNGQEL
ncbi:MAG: hypothetical protein A2Z21_04930 [Candidatus Fraserbacteria bacterium RBG_16_55_9]|uniref:histidine kinase n=1 Tax=Fraserbacteria sp. (strain RBG_16_55_9) TaxID=1817864 RepID=A0A1F5UPX1_FRAXR|nr:MAG: hypothetical protein A2Z21_04930 [Candidatus Fraserbacteria bacterium RBG_16_55_9]